MSLLAGGVPVIVKAGQDQDFKITAAQLEAAITDKTKLVVINSPSNPSGKAYTNEELAALGEVLIKHPNILVATDDMYEHILWCDEPFSNIVMACPALYDQTIVLNGVSKAYSMTGWRIGYAAGPVTLIKAMKKIQSQSTSNPTSISQYAAQAALEGDQSCISEMLVAFKERHDYVVEKLNQIEGVSCISSDGTFYCFPDFNPILNRMSDIDNDVDLAEYILEKSGVALVPGSAFGLDGHMRISIATSMDNLVSAIDRIANLFK
jgi:aspartate aminotransferase